MRTETRNVALVVKVAIYIFTLEKNYEDCYFLILIAKIGDWKLLFISCLVPK